MPNGTIVGTPTFAPGEFNDAISGDGSNYVTLPGTIFDAFMQAGMSWTIGIWLRVKTVPASDKSAFSIGASCPWIGVKNGGDLLVTIFGTGGFGVNIDTGINAVDATGDLHYYEIGMDSGTDLYCSKDGVVGNHTSGVMTGVAGATPRVLDYYAGSFPFVGITATGYAIDELSIWNSCLHTADFTAPSAELVGTEAGLLSLYHFNDNADDSAVVVVPGAVALGEVGGTTLAISWGAATGGTGPYTYQPQKNDNGGGWVNDGSPVSTLKHTFTGLTPLEPYAARVIVTDNASDTAISGSVSATTLAAGLKYNAFSGLSPNSGEACKMLIPNAAAAIPYNSANPTPLIVLYHPSGSDQDFVFDSNFQILAPDLLDAGYLIVCSHAEGENWGNQAGVDDYTDSWRFAIASYNVSVMAGISASMGGLCGLTSLSQWQMPGYVTWLGVYPVCSLADLYAHGFASQINTAFGIGGAHTYADRTAGYDPVLRAGISFRGMPVMCIASPDDVTVDWNANSKALQTLIKDSCDFTLVQASGVHGSTDHWNKAVTFGIPFLANAIAHPPLTSGRIGGGGAITVVQSGSNAILTWDKDPTALHYIVLRTNTDPTLTTPIWTEVAIVAAPTLTYTDTAPTSPSYYALVPTAF